jgi:peptide/nickel transport system ATP-binding protein
LAEQSSLVKIEGLFVNFYTYQGVVKALDGVNLEIFNGETLGLVGETGCGKSVTANTVLRLIPQPPGKIEGGHVYFMSPSGTDTEIEDLRKKIEAAKAAKTQDVDAINDLEGDLKEEEEVRDLRKRIKEYALQNKVDDPEMLEAKKRLDEIMARYDLLARSKKYMQRIRGKYISIIFQEPMSALNPVMNVGSQLTEVTLLHEKRELARSAQRNLKEEQARLKDYKKVSKTRNAKGEMECSACKGMVMEDAEFCPSCNGSFKSKPLRPLTGLNMSYDMAMLSRMERDPDGWSHRILSKVPLARRYMKPVKREAIDRAKRMLRLVRIPDPQNVIRSYPHELSGGMQQRVMIAMALSCKPRMLIADEPTTALDVTIQAQILKLMRELQEETGTSILLITHNLGVVAEVCDRVGVMYAGNIVEIGPKGSIFYEPLHPYTQGLMNSIPRVNLDLPRLETIAGNVPNLIKPPTGCRFHPRCPYAMEVCTVQKPSLTEVRTDHNVACHLYTGVKI